MADVILNELFSPAMRELAVENRIATVEIVSSHLISLLESRDQLEELIGRHASSDKANYDNHITELETKCDQLRSELAALRQSSGALYNWIQGNVTIDERTRGVMNRLYEELDNGVKEDAGEVARLRAELIQKAKEYGQETDTRLLVIKQLRAENEALLVVARAAEYIDAQLRPHGRNSTYPDGCECEQCENWDRVNQSLKELAMKGFRI